MADSPPDPRRARLLALALLAPLALAEAASPRAAPKASADDRTLTIDADSADVDTQSNHLVLRGVTISQTGTSIKASEAEATGPDMSFVNSRWNFRGDVRIAFEGGTLDADRAAVSFAGNRIARAEATGSPAQFEQKIPNRDQTAQGRAGSIDYEPEPGRVTLTQGYWFTDGRNEWRSETNPLIYSVRERRLQSSNGTATPPSPGAETPAPGKPGGRIHIIIRPQDDAGSAEPSPP